MILLVLQLGIPTLVLSQGFLLATEQNEALKAVSENQDDTTYRNSLS